MSLTRTVGSAVSTNVRTDILLIPEDAKSMQRELWAIRVGFWLLGTILAIVQAWSYRYQVTADAIAYLDLSDAVFPNTSWHHIISGVWSPLYPLLLGLGRLVKPARYNESVTAHWINIPIFLFAFAGFEFFLRSFVDSDDSSDSKYDGVLLPQWAYLVLGYTLFLWASITQITLESLRPDMLMAGFLFIAMGLLLQLKKGRATWGRFVGLGVILGLGYLAKEPMLPMGAILLTISVLLTPEWRRSLPKVFVALLLLLAIASFYFIPLSKDRGYFTLGESGSFNYLFHVNHAGPVWYLQDVGSGTGKLLYTPTKIFDAPATFAFSSAQMTTHPLRLDPAYWAQGAKPRFHLRDDVVFRSRLSRLAFGTILKIAGLT